VESKNRHSKEEGWLEGFHWALEHLAREQGVMLEPLELQALGKSLRVRGGVDALRDAASHLGLAPPSRLTLPDQARLPVLAYLGEEGWGVVMGCEPDGSWLIATLKGSQTRTKSSLLDRCYEIQMTRVDRSRATKSSSKGFSDLLSSAWGPFRGSLFEAALATIFMGLLALATSLFSMQVYDRVIPTAAGSTLVVLSMGVLLCILIELTTKFARSHIMDHVTVGLDSRLSREIFQRLLFLRVDQMPSSVGSLAGQLRGYEQVRSFYTAGTLFTLVDVPVALVFLLIIAAIASPFVAMVPFITACVAFAIGLMARRKINQLATEGARYSNMKTGLLVEAVEGVETIKSGSGGWKFLRRWIDLNGITIINDLKMRKSSEGVSYLAGTLQQVSYAGVVAAGALVVMAGDMTMGALIACSILSGRILTPVMALPGLMVQHSHAKAAIEGLDKLYQLKTDNHEVDHPLIPSHLQGSFEFERISFSYEQQAPGLKVPSLILQAGERVGILGSIGSGKSTLLRLLSGMYVPTEGRVLLDGLDLSHISRDVINRHVGYLQQEHRLFQGTVRENLLIGLHDPGDAVLMSVMARTGMDRLVRSHPKGLERMISEGGKGLSGGQRQLLAFTRLLLSENAILLLDEPTANMDQEQEVRCLAVLSELANRGKTLVIVTHKPSLLPLVDRLIVVANNQIVLDGPKEVVLSKLAGANKAARSVIAQKASQEAVA
jgi:ATP-binding cassette subfamily C protein LapB